MNPLSHNDAPGHSRADRLGQAHGFDIKSVTWGYRDVFARTIEQLIHSGHLGKANQDVTERFFSLLNQADQSCFDHVLHEFLGALRPENRWILETPGMFADLVELGAALAENRLSFGISFFRAFAEGQMGQTPRQMRDALTWVRHLRETGDEAAMALLKGYGYLTSRLNQTQLARYIQTGLEILSRKRESGLAFLRCELSSCETYILTLTQECRLCDVDDALAALIQALAGARVQVHDLGGLDSDDIIERGAQVIQAADQLYLPARLRAFDDARFNRKWYLLCALVAAAMIDQNAFPRVHGHADYARASDLAGQSPRRLNLFIVLEIVRVLESIRDRWPGARGLVDFALRSEFELSPPRCDAQRLLRDAATGAPGQAVARTVSAARSSVNCFDTVSKLDEPWVQAVLEEYSRLDQGAIGPMSFVSDFQFPIHLSVPPSEAVVADLKHQAKAAQADHTQEQAPGQQADPDVAQESGDQNEAADGQADIAAAYLYDEWDFQQNEYRQDWCKVHEVGVAPGNQTTAPGNWQQEAQRVRAIFERLKPEIVRKEKYLPDGEKINLDLLVEHRVQRKHEPAPKVRFYEKPMIQRRDLAVLILLDLSGSTGEELQGRERVLDLEKRAAVTLGEGLSALDDRFAVNGFSSNGPEHCEYFVFKRFADRWTNEPKEKIFSAWPRNSTRIGPALRHAGYLLGKEPNRQKLILLITDGKPMDQGYDPNTRYAQHDVRMACEENVRKDVHTFAISTRENSQADMEIMFPRRRFVILHDLHELPRVLPKLYLNLTL
jgi:hypothetical protein